MKDTFVLIENREVIDPSVFSQGDIVTYKAGTSTQITNSHTVSGDKIIIDYPDLTAEAVDVYIGGVKKISDRSVIDPVRVSSNAIFDTIRVGTNNELVSFPKTKALFSNGDTEETTEELNAAFFEAVSPELEGETSNAIFAVGKTRYIYEGRAIYAKALVSQSGDTADAVASVFESIATHAGGRNVALRVKAANGSSNISIDSTGDILSNDNILLTGILKKSGGTYGISFDSNDYLNVTNLVANFSGEIIASKITSGTRVIISHSQTTTTFDGAVQSVYKRPDGAATPAWFRVAMFIGAAWNGTESINLGHCMITPSVEVGTGDNCKGAFVIATRSTQSGAVPSRFIFDHEGMRPASSSQSLILNIGTELLPFKGAFLTDNINIVSQDVQTAIRMQSGTGVYQEMLYAGGGGDAGSTRFFLRNRGTLAAKTAAGLLDDAVTDFFGTSDDGDLYGYRSSVTCIKGYSSGNIDFAECFLGVASIATGAGDASLFSGIIDGPCVVPVLLGDGSLTNKHGLVDIGQNLSRFRNVMLTGVVRQAELTNSTPAAGDQWVDSVTKAKAAMLQGVAQYQSGFVYVSKALATIANTTTETTLLTATATGTKTLPANFFTVGKKIKIKTMGFISTSGNPNTTMRIKTGATTLITSTITMSPNLSNAFVQSEIDIICLTTGSSGTVILSGVSHVITGSAVTCRPLVVTSAATIDTTGALAIDQTYEWGTASAGNTVTITTATIEVIG